MYDAIPAQLGKSHLRYQIGNAIPNEKRSLKTRYQCYFAVADYLFLDTFSPSSKGYEMNCSCFESH